MVGTGPGATAPHHAMPVDPDPSMPARVPVVRAYLLGLQQRICGAIADIDGKPFLDDAWEKTAAEPLQGDGLTRILEQGAVFERAGCGFSHVRGVTLPPSATHNRPELAGAPFEALGVSLVFHPRNPYVPTVHMNVRMISATPGPAATPTSGGRRISTVVASSVAVIAIDPGVSS